MRPYHRLRIAVHYPARPVGPIPRVISLGVCCMVFVSLSACSATSTTARSSSAPATSPPTVAPTSAPTASTPATAPRQQTVPSTPGVPSAPGLITEPDQGMTPIYSLIQSPTRTLDMSMYELVDTRAESLLAADAGRGVSVRVILDHRYETSHNQPAYSYLVSHGVHVQWAPPSFSAFHVKMICVDDSTCSVMTLNLTSRYYATTRDFAVSDSTPADVTSMEQTFTADFDSSSIIPPNGTDLVWSPGSTGTLTSLIGSATSELLIYNEEMSDPAIVSSLASAARRGVAVRVVMTDQTSWHPEFSTLTTAGVQVRLFHGETPVYIHAKMVWVDGKEDFIGSENFSQASLTRNRELGIVLTDPAILSAIHHTFDADFAGAAPWGT